MKKFFAAAILMVAFSGVAEARGCRLFSGRFFGGRSCGQTTYGGCSQQQGVYIQRVESSRPIYMPSPSDGPGEVTQPVPQPKKVPLPMPGASD